MTSVLLLEIVYVLQTSLILSEILLFKNSSFFVSLDGNLDSSNVFYNTTS